MRTFWQSKVKISVLALWLGVLSSLFHNMSVGGMDVILSLYVPDMFSGVWKLSSLWMCYTQICPCFECGTNTLYTRVYSVSSLWMPGQVGATLGVWIFKCTHLCDLSIRFITEGVNIFILKCQMTLSTVNSHSPWRRCFLNLPQGVCGIQMELPN